MDELLFFVVAIALYIACDRALDFAERRAGRRYENRTLVFFGLLLGSALLVFWILRHFANT